ncbi:7-carboxy-7-deazaguanine synthase [Pseudomonas phage sp. 30-3]|uniref:7-carboxy-7-deazaguanine synthase n=1 Tax=Pseudomonas phage vB_PaeM_PA5oct TaxID=2163605 RepID=A0A4Y5JYC7_9CAUD|nr:QueE-like radical SAM domain [Pseudomonas phage vB_PaeM_PA5oct]WMI31867.1 7-carboxy-7-deazaguanine synthase [Pseudomonas phage Callisto]WPK38797.1 QueE-like radical SAM domain [Pseudomonas phage Cassandra]WPK39318.1 QueE-like radical SAM domain [Pseudomonas phage Deifobo]WPK39830.1 QueE-like radical SAM domain [Pseudomonas phage Ettore]WPK40351.1 QueE-like radical SAM domain [Pseudomonas phage Paride]VOH54559.1 7-carboxy-7-deazaguanine synthase [Pseudomonas phage vB_PaeM_MIJ3]BDR25724.1 7
MKHRYTEKFFSVQGESLHTGKLCTWLRFFGCSLQCRGFGQKEPGNPETWVEQRPDLIDVTNITDYKQLPTPKYGCDSDYSVFAKFKHLATEVDPVVVANEIKQLIPSKTFGKKIGHVFTGGEPLVNQESIVDIVNYWIDTNDYPAWIGIETNTTRPLEKCLIDLVNRCKSIGVQFYFSMSPKLLHVAGEQPKRAIHINLMKEYIDIAPDSYLKFVVNEDQRSWDQAKSIVDTLNADGYLPDVWVMPVGGIYSQQTDPVIGRLADKAIFEYEWNVSLRVHVLTWGDDQLGR